jgi:ubiquinone/menaquinone biosynthesis C-methylase UbiE
MIDHHVQYQRNHYNRIGHTYDARFINSHDEHYVALDFLTTFIEPLGIKTMLDVGCGTGRGVKYFWNKNISVKGIEPVLGLLKQATHNNKASLICGDGQFLPFRDNEFDASFELGVLHHVKNPDNIVKEMIRVSKKAVFISDSNRFGQGTMISRLIKLILYKMRLWNVVNILKTGGKGYTFNEDGDGLAYSYSIFDSYDLIAKWADRIILIPTKQEKLISWFHPLMTSSHVLLCALKDNK